MENCKKCSKNIGREEPNFYPCGKCSCDRATDLTEGEMLRSLLAVIGSATHDKEYWFLQEDGMVYSRESCKELTKIEAIAEISSHLYSAVGMGE